MDHIEAAEALLETFNNERVRCGTQTADGLDEEAFVQIRVAAENFLGRLYERDEQS